MLNNLLSNSIKFTHQGKITIYAFVGKKGSRLSERIPIQGQNWPGSKDVIFEEDELVVAVSDTGVGISTEQMPKLFNKFTQLEQSVTSEKRGTGLGLVIAKGIVEAHNGKIGVFSQEGIGTTFYFMLPLRGSEVHEERHQLQNQKN